ncbi:MAG: AraC family transcriptional regulator [Bacteroidota bacterium]
MLQSYTLPVWPVLQPYCKGIWGVSAHGKGYSQIEPMIPFACMDLVLVLKGNMRYIQAGEAPKPAPRLFLAGQVTRPYWMEYGPGVQTIAVGFQAHAAHYFLQDKAALATDVLVDGKDFLPGPVVSVLMEQIDQAVTLQAKVHILQQFLLNRLQQGRFSAQKQSRLLSMLQLIHLQNGHLDLRKLAQSLGISPRYTQQLFKDAVGMRPGLYTRIIRFLQTIPALNASEASLTQLALESGYFDQAHFIRDFRQFTGCTPGQYQGIPHDLLDQFTAGLDTSLLYN